METIRMRQSKEEPSSCTALQAIDLISAVKQLHKLSSQELGKLMKDSDNLTIQYLSENEEMIKVDMGRLAGFLPLHLMAVLMTTNRDEALLTYLLSGIRLLHSLCELAPRNAKLEQILLEDIKVSEQLLDLVFYLLIFLGGYRKENHNSCKISVLHSTLVACSLYLLMGFISSQWQDLVHVLLAHPKVHIFMDAAFRVVHESIRFLAIKLSDNEIMSFSTNLNAEQIVYSLCLQCDASLQFLQTLCQQKVFRERLLRNKELCGKGGVLFLARAILKLTIRQPLLQSSRIVAAVSRLKAKVLSILLSLCEAENISYLDEVASSPRSSDLAKSVALQVLELLKTVLSRDPKILTPSNKSYPVGFLQLNAMRLVDMFSDDSNFRSYITVNFTRVVAAVFALSHGDFLSIWCSSDLPVREEDATLEYDSFAAAGWVLNSFSSLENQKDLEFTLIPNNMPTSSYAHQRTSLFVKVIANLHCFVPNICEEQERNLFLRTFVDCLKMDLSKELPGFSCASDTPSVANVCRNLRSLLSQAESLIPTFLNEEDVHLLRVFVDQLQKMITSAEFGGNQVVEDGLEESMSWGNQFSKLKIGDRSQEITEGFLSPLMKGELSNVNTINGNLKEAVSENSAFQGPEFPTESDNVDRGEGLSRQHRSKDEGISGRNAAEGLKDEREGQNVETSGSDTNSARGRNAIGQMENGEFSKSSEPVKENRVRGHTEDEKVEAVHREEKHRRKRKRTIMNDKQVALMETALLDEPDMQRNAASIQSWADKLSLHGSEVTTAQLKNWLNNRKARLARTAKDVKTTSEAENTLPDKVTRQGAASSEPDSPGEDNNNNYNNSQGVSNSARDGKSWSKSDDKCKPGEQVMLIDGEGEEIAKGKVYQVQGQWCGRNLEELETYVVDITELKAERDTVLLYPSELMGMSFQDSESNFGVMRVLWDINKTFSLQS